MTTKRTITLLSTGAFFWLIDYLKGKIIDRLIETHNLPMTPFIDFLIRDWLYILIGTCIFAIIYLAVKWKIFDTKSANSEDVESLKTIIRNRYNDYLLKNPIQTSISVPSHRQNRLDDVLTNLIKEGITMKGWNELQKIGKESLVGLDIGHDGMIL